MTKFKVGNQVRVRKDLEVGRSYGHNTFINSMKKYLGEILTITKTDCNDYEVKENTWNWTDEMLENIVTSIHDLEFGDILTLRNGERYVYADEHMYGEKETYIRDRDTLTTWYDEDLKQNEDNKEQDIMKVERAGQVIYEREDVREMTVEEISRALGYEVKVVK